MKVLIVDDHVMFREGLVVLLAAQPDIKIVGQAGALHEAIDLARQLHPDVVLMDYGLPDGNGVNATTAILAENPATKIIIVTVHSASDRLFACLRAGAKGYVLKDAPIADLVQAIRAIEKNESALSPDMTWRMLDEFSKSSQPGLLDQPGLASLTVRELQILNELTTYATNAEIAARLSVSETTIKNHVHAILKKLQFKNRRQVIRYMKEEGLKKFA